MATIQITAITTFVEVEERRGFRGWMMAMYLKEVFFFKKVDSVRNLMFNSQDHKETRVTVKALPRVGVCATDG